MKKNRAIILGGAGVDVIVQGVPIKEAFRRESTPADRIVFSAGGDAMNEACAIAKCGHEVELICGIGDDYAGRLIQDEAADANVDCSHIVVDKCHPTSMNCVVVDVGGERRFLSPPFSQAMYYDLSENMIGDAEVLSLASLFVPPIIDPQTVLPLVRKARAAGIKVCADMNIVPGFILEDWAEVLSYVDYIFPNEEESRYFTGKDDAREAADVLLELGVGCVIAKVGSRGAYLCRREGKELIPAYKTRSVDTTGAGDNFLGGFISGLLDHEDDVYCCRRAAAAAAIAVSAIGATTGIQSKEQVLHVIETGRVTD